MAVSELNQLWNSNHHCGVRWTSQWWHPVICSYSGDVLYHLPLDNMAAILANDIFKCIFLNENVRISIKISLKFVSKGSIDNKPALVLVMAWHRTGDKPLPEAMLTQFTDAYMGHQGKISLGMSKITTIFQVKCWYAIERKYSYFDRNLIDVCS